MVTVLIFGGQDTTQCQLACAVATFLRHPGQWELLAKDPELAAPAAEEVLRYEPAGSGSPRVATEAFRHRELEIPAGLVALPSAPSANRDPEVYPDPERFDVTRRHPEPQLTFGGGVHYCLGASLARLEARVSFEELLRRVPEFHVSGPVERLHSAVIRGLLRVPLEFKAA